MCYMESQYIFISTNTSVHLNAGSPCPRPPRRACRPCCTGRAPGPPSSAAPGPAPRRTPAVRCTPAGGGSQCYNHGPASAAVTCSTAVEPPPVVGFMVLWPPTTWPSPVRSSTRSSSALQPITAQLSPLSTNHSSALTALHQSELSCPLDARCR